MFKKYQHIERFGTEEVENINIGKCYVFPKLDGTNGSVWLENNELHFGSRKRELSLEQDNASFMASLINDDRFKKYLTKFPSHILYGEWLVKHTIKTYRDDAWYKFYIFDVYDTETEKYLDYEIYSEYLKEFNLEFIAPLVSITNGSLDDFMKNLDKNTYLLKDGEIGEGIVIKRYDFINKYGRTTWAKIVRNEFKDEHRKKSEILEINKEPIEYKICVEYLTPALIEKELSKIKLDSGFTSKEIPRLLNQVYHELVTEEIWHIVKKYKQPTIDFKQLNKYCIERIKTLKPELF